MRQFLVDEVQTVRIFIILAVVGVYTGDDGKDKTAQGHGRQKKENDESDGAALSGMVILSDFCRDTLLPISWQLQNLSRLACGIRCRLYLVPGVSAGNNSQKSQHAAA